MLTFHRLDVFPPRPFVGSRLAVVVGADAPGPRRMPTLARARLTPAGVGADVQARMISTGTGIPEHHATGSVSAILAVQPHAVGLVAPGITRSPLMQGVEVARPPDLALTTWVGGRTAIRVKGAAVPISSGLLHMPELPPATD